MKENIVARFEEKFDQQPLVFAAPGRVNLIGEHTDYNEGFVLPGAVDKRIYVGIARNDSNLLNVWATQYQQKFSYQLDVIQPVKNWSTYLLGMAYHIKQMGHDLSGVNVVIDGDVPLGAGMSSSAAVCSAFGFALNDIFGLGLSRMELALLGQKTEHRFAGVKCGIMDQFASLHGKKGHVIKLDCRSLGYEYIPFDFPDYKIVLVNTMVSHTLASSEYNARRQQCEEGVRILKKYFPSAKSLRDIDEAQLEKHKNDMSDLVYRRCRFVVTENERLLRGCDLLKKGDLKSFGDMMFEAHEGLSKWYEVSCKESDFLVASAKQHEAVAGSRQMGGGFGGCTINIVKTDAVEDFSSYISERYIGQFKIVPEIYVTQIEDGAKRAE
ncbi:MAG: galactokinase [Bacteroidetes bacterium]|nr:galactokinase [Bacteroidota bacterium]MBS1974200.1 galactokinase [Bacteroidota bacterium]